MENKHKPEQSCHGAAMPRKPLSSPGGAEPALHAGTDPRAQGKEVTFPTRSTLATSLVGNTRTKESHRHLSAPRWKKWSWQHSRRGRRILNIFTRYFKASSAVSHTSVDDRQPLRRVEEDEQSLLSSCAPAALQGHPQLSICSDCGTQTPPNPWAQPTAPGKGKKTSSGLEDPAYSSQSELAASTHGWAAPTHPPTAAWQQHGGPSMLRR